MRWPCSPPFQAVKLAFITSQPILVEGLWKQMEDPDCGGLCVFEGRVRRMNQGKQALRLEYACYEPMALKKMKELEAEAIAGFGAQKALAVHRVGNLEIGELAVWVGASAPHRDEAFKACRFLIDAIKHQVPVWKKETYEDGSSEWVLGCSLCKTEAALA